ncbi:MAG: hypothetical protein IT428_16850 [Planctomycetaceae bacterium]|nr:hypothetical protein [Planctomycetaceae bacterium]
MRSSPKQGIVMRHDLSMRRGKQIAQAAHASMSFSVTAIGVLASFGGTG